MTSVEATVFVSDELYQAVRDFPDFTGYEPAQVIKEHLEDIIQAHGATANVTWSSGRYVQSSGVNTIGDVLDDFTNNFLEGRYDEAADVNQLLITNDEITVGSAVGLAWSDSGVSRDGEILANHFDSGELYGNADSAIEQSIFTAIHEIGHQLGGKHRHGTWEYESKGLIRTPFGSKPSNSNPNCGEKESDTNLDYHKYKFADCTWQQMNI